jgi:hypothetical protein
MSDKPKSIVFALLFTACGWPEGLPSDSSYTDGGEDASAETTTTDGNAVQSDDDSTGSVPGWTGPVSEGPAESEAGGDDGVGFIMPPDGGTAECDIWAQDCGEGEKCTIWANDGGNAWNATKCVTVQPNPAQEDDPCVMFGEGWSGDDNCDFGTFCWDMDPDTGLGICVPFCEGSEANPTCADPGKACVGKDFYICLPICSPLVQDCPVGCACFPASDEFRCVPVAAAADEGLYGDPCEFTNVCQVGLFCASPDAVPGCADSIGCCSSFCDLAAPECPAADEGVECIAWYEEGQAPGGLESVGACAIPL